jgi:hypothetical protein
MHHRPTIAGNKRQTTGANMPAAKRMTLGGASNISLNQSSRRSSAVIGPSGRPLNIANNLSVMKQQCEFVNKFLARDGATELYFLLLPLSLSLKIYSFSFIKCNS